MSAKLEYFALPGAVSTSAAFLAIDFVPMILFIVNAWDNNFDARQSVV